MIIGNKGQLGNELQKRLNCPGVDINELDITNLDQVIQFLTAHKPDIVINCAAYNLVDKAETHFQDAYMVNTFGIHNLGLVCKQLKIFLVHYSTDYVFDGKKFAPYFEQDKTNPLCEYGKSKLLGEILLQNLQIPYLLLRTSWLYGEGTQNFVYKLKQLSLDKTELKITLNEISVPTSTKTLVDITLKALDMKLEGVFHAVCSGYTTRFDFAEKILIGKKIKLIPVSIASFNLPAQRPIFSAMSNQRLCDLGFTIPSWQEDLECFIENN